MIKTPEEIEISHRRLRALYEVPDELSASSQPDIPAEVELQGSPAPSEDTYGTPPVGVSEDPHAVPSVTPALDAASNVPVVSKFNRHFTTQEIQIALQLREKGLSLREIAVKLDRSIEGVRNIIAEWTPTRDLAKAILKKNAHKFAEKIVTQADVDQSMEVLDRLDVLPKKERDSGGNKVQVIIGLDLDKVTPVGVIDVEKLDEA